MCEIVELDVRRKKKVSRVARRGDLQATTYVLVPNERLSQLREFWLQLKAEIAEADTTPQHLLRR
jgi:hypothetical protein